MYKRQEEPLWQSLKRPSETNTLTSCFGSWNRRSRTAAGRPIWKQDVYKRQGIQSGKGWWRIRPENPDFLPLYRPIGCHRVTMSEKSPPRTILQIPDGRENWSSALSTSKRAAKSPSPACGCPAWRKMLSGRGSPTWNHQQNTMRCTTCLLYTSEQLQQKKSNHKTISTTPNREESL